VVHTRLMSELLVKHICARTFTGVCWGCTINAELDRWTFSVHRRWSASAVTGLPLPAPDHSHTVAPLQS